MNKGRYEQYGYESFKDTKTGDIRYDFIDIMNEQDQKIKELEHRLANCIESKFRVGDKAYFVSEITKTIDVCEIEEVLLNKYGTQVKSMDWNQWFFEDELYATEEEAKAKLEELKNG